VYVKDCVEVLWWFYRHRGRPRHLQPRQRLHQTWNDLTQAVFDAMGARKQIDYIEMPEAIPWPVSVLQEAKIDKLRTPPVSRDVPLPGGCRLRLRRQSPEN